MIYCFDLDGTLCETVSNGYYPDAQPYRSAIEKVNSLYDAGHRIVIFTGRGSSSGIDWTEATQKQINSWGLKHHALITNKKPTYDVVIDDKAVNAAEWRKINCGQRGIVAGAFDVIHPGYCRMFEYAKKHCDHLTVALHEDPSVEREKMSPTFNASERIEVLKSLKHVDEVVVYKTEKDLEQLITSKNYDIRFLGEDYASKQFTAHDADIKLIFVPRNHEYSTTKFKKDIAESYARYFK